MATYEQPYVAQFHNEFDHELLSNKFDHELMCPDRPHAAEVPPPGQRGYPDVYVNGPEVGMVTVTIDPMKNSHWIRDDSGRAAMATHRGALKDHEGVMRAAGLLDRHPAPPRSYIPKSSEIDALDKFTPRCVLNSTRGYVGAPGHKARVGKLPRVSEMIYSNKLGEGQGHEDFRAWDDVNWTYMRGNRDRSLDCGGGIGMCR